MTMKAAGERDRSRLHERKREGSIPSIKTRPLVVCQDSQVVKSSASQSTYATGPSLSILSSHLYTPMLFPVIIISNICCIAGMATAN